jgi:hypothetical protein
MARLVCRCLGHRWTPLEEIRYEQDKTMATYVEASGDPVEVSVTWVCDEMCSRCGAETWWPS